MLRWLFSSGATKGHVSEADVFHTEWVLDWNQQHYESHMFNHTHVIALSGKAMPIIHRVRDLWCDLLSNCFTKQHKEKVTFKLKGVIDGPCSSLLDWLLFNFLFNYILAIFSSQRITREVWQVKWNCKDGTLVSASFLLEEIFPLQVNCSVV